MCASLETLTIAAYVFATTFRLARPGPVGKVSDEEIVALAVAQAITGTVSDRRFLGTIGRLLPGFFPHLPDQAQYNRRLRRLTPWLTTVQLMLAELVADGHVRLADGTLIACANYPGCQSHSQFAGHAAYGYCPSKSQVIWGMRLVLLADPKGVPVGYDLVGPKTGQERDAARSRRRAPRQRAVRRRRPRRPRVPVLDAADRHPADHPGQTQALPAPTRRDRQGPHPAGHRVGIRDPQTPDGPARPPSQDAPRPGRPHRPTTARAHPRHLPQPPPRPASTRARRLRRTMNPHQASSRLTAHFGHAPPDEHSDSAQSPPPNRGDRDMSAARHQPTRGPCPPTATAR